MKLNPYNNVQHGPFIGFYPLLITLILLALHFYSGALNWPEDGDVGAQRNFNSAIGMSVLTGYFWFTLRMLHQNVASCLILILVKTNQLSQFSYHRNQLTSEFIFHIFNATIIAILLTVVYVVIEGLLSATHELEVLLLTAAAVPFWFFSWLFLFQITSNIRYIINFVLPNSEHTFEYLESLVALIKLGLANGIFSMGALSIFPIFWFKKDVPSVDVFLVTIFSATLAVYLFMPVFKLRIKLKKAKKAALEALEHKIENEIIYYNQNDSANGGSKLNQYQTDKENILNLSTRVINARDKVRIAACISLVPISWLLVQVFA